MYVHRLTDEQRRARVDFKTIVACDANTGDVLHCVTAPDLLHCVTAPEVTAVLRGGGRPFTKPVYVDAVTVDGDVAGAGGVVVDAESADTDVPAVQQQHPQQPRVKWRGQAGGTFWRYTPSQHQFDLKTVFVRRQRTAVGDGVKAAEAALRRRCRHRSTRSF